MLTFVRNEFLSTPSSQRATHIIPAIGPLKLFLSTPSSQRATSSRARMKTAFRYFYPRPLRRGRPLPLPRMVLNIHFYPRPLRRGRRLYKFRSVEYCSYFYPRPLRRGRRGRCRLCAPLRVFLSTPSSQRATRSTGG